MASSGSELREEIEGKIVSKLFQSKVLPMLSLRDVSQFAQTSQTSRKLLTEASFGQLLQHVKNGRQDQAEAILQKTPELFAKSSLLGLNKEQIIMKKIFQNKVLPMLSLREISQLAQTDSGSYALSRKLLAGALLGQLGRQQKTSEFLMYKSDIANHLDHDFLHHLRLNQLAFLACDKNMWNMLFKYARSYVLICMILQDEQEAAHKLIELKHCDLNFRDKHGDTALTLAVRKNHQDIARALIAAGANVDIPNHKRETALIYAIENRNFFIINLLLTHGAQLTEVKISLDILNCALFLAIKEKKNLFTISVLLARGAQIELGHSVEFLHFLNSCAQHDPYLLMCSNACYQQEQKRGEWGNVKVSERAIRFLNIGQYDAVKKRNLFTLSFFLAQGSQIGDLEGFLDFLNSCDQRDPYLLMCLSALCQQRDAKLAARGPDDKTYQQAIIHCNKLATLSSQFATRVHEVMDKTINEQKKIPKGILSIINGYDAPIEGNRMRFFKPDESLRPAEVYYSHVLNTDTTGCCLVM